MGTVNLAIGIKPQEIVKKDIDTAFRMFLERPSFIRETLLKECMKSYKEIMSKIKED